MELNDEIDDPFEDTEILEELLDIDNVEAVPPDHSDIISVGEESVIEECLNDTEGSLSSVNLDFFNDDKPIKFRRKKTMEKRKEERMSFRHVGAKATVSDDEDDEESMVLETAAKNELAALSFQIQQIKDSMRSPSKKNESTDTVEGKKILDPNHLEQINQFIHPLHTPNNDKEREPEELLLDDDIKMGVLREKIRFEELQKNCEEDRVKLLSIIKKPNVSVDRRKKILLSSKSDSKEKSDKEFPKIEVIDFDKPSTSKIANVKKWVSECDEKKGELYSDDEIVPRSGKDSNVAKKKVVRRKRRVSAKSQEVAKNDHIYSFFSSMADLVSTLPYSVTLTAKASVTKMLEEMVERMTKPQEDTSPQAITSREINEEDLKLIKSRLSKLPYIY